MLPMGIIAKGQAFAESATANFIFFTCFKFSFHLLLPSIAVLVFHYMKKYILNGLMFVYQKSDWEMEFGRELR